MVPTLSVFDILDNHWNFYNLQIKTNFKNKSLTWNNYILIRK